jgi:hypothetical protein
MKQRIISFIDKNDSLPSFDNWVMWPGQTITEEGKRVEVRKIEWDGEPCFLKVSHSESLTFLLRQLYSGYYAISSPQREALTLISLKNSGFAVIPVLVAGTAYKCGRPSQGFMVTKAINGMGLDECLINASHDQRRELLKNYGRLMALLHQLKYYEPLRCTDVLVDEDRFILLDRTDPIQWFNSICHPSMVRKSVLRSAYRNRRAGVILGAKDIEDICTGYADVERKMINIVREELLRIYRG